MSRIAVGGMGGPVSAVVRVPGSKSVANRALMCAALARSGVSRVSNVPSGDDCAAMLRALDDSGCLSAGGMIIGGMFPGAASRFDAGIAGTTSRFLTAASALSATGIVVDGGEPLRRRPMSDLHDALRQLGAEVGAIGEPGHLPVRVSSGRISGGRVTVRGDVSSQFLSALMLLGPRLPGGLEIEVSGNLVSRPYVEMTAAVMRSFGASAVLSGSTVSVGEVPYRATDYDVEPDFSSAAFPLMSIVFTHGHVTVPGLARATMQGDSFILEIARMMGLVVDVGTDDVTVTHGQGAALRPVDVDLRDASDLVPAVATACTVLPGVSRLRGVGFIRTKESDRLGDLSSELNSAGADVRVLDDGLEIHGGSIPSSVTDFRTHHDHRLAMAFSLIATGGGRCVIDDGDVVSKSWPGYFADMSGLLGTVDRLN